jgi:uncharacterized protein (UPF0212 family)
MIPDTIHFPEPCPGCGLHIAPWLPCCSTCLARLPQSLRAANNRALARRDQIAKKEAATAIRTWLQANPVKEAPAAP